MSERIFFYFTEMPGMEITRSSFCLLIRIQMLIPISLPHRSSIIECFERAKQKYNPQKTIDVPQATVTFDELHRRYKEVYRNDRPSN